MARHFKVSVGSTDSWKNGLVAQNARHFKVIQSMLKVEIKKKGAQKPNLKLGSCTPLLAWVDLS
ncbi:MAG: hypothetical protein D6E12_08725 [Desulfovibrio sp.]|nr:MAG: hypothetical protein D6E12_08725 [Desulfovibrio sp.]